jgi:hypothetical protein
MSNMGTAKKLMYLYRRMMVESFRNVLILHKKFAGFLYNLYMYANIMLFIDCATSSVLLIHNVSQVSYCD